MLSNPKVAVVLAARKEYDSDVPYPLMPYIEGECLIDRTLQILRECGYDRIIIVAGYKAELFEKYIDNNVTLVVNDSYEYTSSMGSLAIVKDLISDDFLLVEGDTFYERVLIERLVESEYSVCLAMTEETGSGDECYVETKLNFVHKITKDRHRVCNVEGELIGVMRLSLEVYQKMLNLYFKSTNPYLNYEYLLMDVTEAVDRPVIRFRNLIWGDVDSYEDFKRLQNITYRNLCRKENPFDIDNLKSYLKQIFPNHDTDKAIIIQIGGMSNKNYKVSIGNKEYVLRIPGNGSEGMVDRTNEEYNALEASKMGVNPPVRYFNPETGIKLTDYIANAETLNSATIQRHDNMCKVAEIYRKVHYSRVRLKNEFNIFREIVKYEQLLERSGVQMYEGWELIRPKVMGLEERLNNLGVELCACHNDAVPENFIKSDDGKIYLIDWEYSGTNDPMADFAALFLESDFSPENQSFILRQYYQGEIRISAFLKIKCYMVLWDYLWALWTLIKEANGDDFGTYGIDRYNRAKHNLFTLDN